jgi:hypothetical protein
MFLIEFNMVHSTKAINAQRMVAYLYSFFNLSARRGGLSKPSLGFFAYGEDPVPILWEAYWT